jgi:hypothetical protein
MLGDGIYITEITADLSGEIYKGAVQYKTGGTGTFLMTIGARSERKSGTRKVVYTMRDQHFFPIGGVLARVI